MHYEILPLTRQWMLAVHRMVQNDFANELTPFDSVNWRTSRVVVQTDSPRLIGCLLLEHDGYVAYLVVHEKFRGKGIGSALLRHSATDIKSLSCVKSLVGFYEQRGFQIKESYALNHGEVLYRMISAPRLHESPPQSCAHEAASVAQVEEEHAPSCDEPLPQILPAESLAN